jgi:DNA-binding MarR family transcriptional regulator
MTESKADATTDPRWLNAEEDEAWRTLLPILELVPAAIDAQLKRDNGITRFEYNVLAMMSDSVDNTRPMTDLAVMTNGSLSRLSHAVGKLETRGWLVRYASGEDRRISLISLTEEGRAMLEKAAPSHVEEVRRLLFDVIPADKLALLTEILLPVAARSMGEDAAWAPKSSKP